MSSRYLFPSCIDLVNPDTHSGENLVGIFRGLRQKSPIYWYERDEKRFWVVLGNKLGTDILKRPDIFSSKYGNVIDTLLSGGDPAGGKMLAVSEGKRHKEVRIFLAKYFKLANFRDHTASLPSNCIERLKDLTELSQVYIISDYAKYIPLDVISSIMGITDVGMKEELYYLANKSLSDLNDESLSVYYRRQFIYLLSQYLSTLSPGNMVHDLQRSDLELSTEELIYNCYSLFIGGEETTRLTIGRMFYEFATDKMLWRQFKAQRHSCEQAADEFLRVGCSALHVARTVVADCDFQGIRMREGDVVSIWHQSTNYDEEVFSDPYSIDLLRTPNRHLSFSSGPHVCLGANLAKYEIASALEAARSCLGDIELVCDPEHLRSNFLHGYSQLKVKLCQ